MTTVTISCSVTDYWIVYRCYLASMLGRNARTRVVAKPLHRMPLWLDMLRKTTEYHRGLPNEVTIGLEPYKSRRKIIKGNPIVRPRVDPKRRLSRPRSNHGTNKYRAPSAPSVLCRGTLPGRNTKTYATGVRHLSCDGDLSLWLFSHSYFTVAYVYPRVMVL